MNQLFSSCCLHIRQEFIQSDLVSMADLGFQTSGSADMDVVIRHKHLCHSEEQFTMKRQIIVQNTLERHDIHVPDVKNVPRVALLGSGGGQRAHTSFLGVIQQLYKEELLDGFHYVAGVSGSTWSMSSLYQNPTWSQDAVKVTEEALLNMSKGTGPTLLEAVKWFMEREKHGNFSLSDVWGAITCRIKGVPLETRTLTEDKHGANPYPLYSTVERHCFDCKKTKEMWFEFSPHESGFLQHGAYVDTSLLNNNFDGGHVKPSHKKPVNMVQLQGMCGCAMGDFAQIVKTIEDILWNWGMLPHHFNTSIFGTIL
ncbi:cytosolic phospholipase A2 zeta-like [Clupea harengus]|uniref:Cytosolic phospholipase A2 zeta-like n=1 Tax=Clupea harengus TaxID=7950 RepID=A0A6P8F395_CLUHA|nr:cytosolic phospholipase A2 zeta-like [Clupea harengus]